MASVPGSVRTATSGDARSKLKTQRRLPRTLTARQVAAIVGACERLRDRFLIELLAGAGIRIGEALGLWHEDIDAASTLIRIRLRDNSNGARAKDGQREIPVAPGLIRLYTEYLDGSPARILWAGARNSASSNPAGLGEWRRRRRIRRSGSAGR
ncbi:tyrosine-type recombinase/integrase [Nocardia gamkensis]|uniref:tyrosine-type recombinase/integrase n=1 Tax=Nocardia gamkensis TaxID=352869 RepID=UPI0036E39D94